MFYCLRILLANITFVQIGIRFLSGNQSLVKGLAWFHRARGSVKGRDGFFTAPSMTNLFDLL